MSTIDTLFSGSRKHPSASKKANRARANAERAQIKLDAANERQGYRNSLSPMQQITRLDKRLGMNVGAAKERARLKAILEAAAAKEEAAQQAAITAKAEKETEKGKKKGGKGKKSK